MFWSISLLLQKMIKTEESTTSKSYAILGSALVGSITFAFTDSFWFNAVETEVYAMATLIMAVMFYLALRWEEDMHKPRGIKPKRICKGKGKTPNKRTSKYSHAFTCDVFF